MHAPLDETIEILEKLVGFESVSGRPTHDIVAWITAYLDSHGVESTLSYDADGQRANVFATIGPAIDGGVVLNGHTDVVPVAGQQWQSNPFALTRVDDKLYGRGAVDMKGFLACVLASVPRFQQTRPALPIHIAFTFDEEIGGYGMPVLLDDMASRQYRPSVVIVGEPTEMNIITGHKGGYEMRTEVTGVEAHSSDPRNGVSAISYALPLMHKIEEIAARHTAAPIADSPYDPPYTTFNNGKIDGGMARNATAGWCHFDWEFRPLPGQHGDAIIAEIMTTAAELEAQMQAIDIRCRIDIITEVAVPALDDRHADEATAFVAGITGLNSRDVVSFASDAGYFSDANYSTVLFGPGSIDRAHKPDEYITVQELSAGLDFLAALATHLK